MNDEVWFKKISTRNSEALARHILLDELPNWEKRRGAGRAGVNRCVIVSSSNPYAEGDMGKSEGKLGITTSNRDFSNFCFIYWTHIS
jgi:hypothetical protein